MRNFAGCRFEDLKTAFDWVAVVFSVPSRERDLRTACRNVAYHAGLGPFATPIGMCGVADSALTGGQRSNRNTPSKVGADSNNVFAIS